MITLPGINKLELCEAAVMAILEKHFNDNMSVAEGYNESRIVRPVSVTAVKSKIDGHCQVFVVSLTTSAVVA